LTATASGELLWDPANPDHIQDPYPAYEILRAHAPVWRHPVAWVLSTMQDVEPALRDRRLLNHGLEGEHLMARVIGGLPAPIGEVTHRHQSPWILFQSGDHHALMRRLLNRGFSASSLERVRPAVHRVGDDLSARVRDEPRFDFMEEFAFALPIAMISELFAVPLEMRPLLRQLLGPLGRTMTGVAVTAEVMTEVDEAVREFEDAMRTLIAERRLRPSDDMISLLIGDDADGVMSEREVLSNLGVLLFAGYETTVGLLGNGLFALLRHPEQRELLCREPLLATNAVEEMLRYDAPTQRVARIVHEPVEIRGQVLQRGELVWPMLGSANRDPEAHADPDRFDVRRTDPKPLSFGKGPHFCIGAPLARMEAQIAFPTLLPAIRSHNLADDVVRYNPTATLRAPSELWLER
jgi:cytochrome P450